MMIHKKQFTISAILLLIGIFLVHGLSMVRGTMKVVETRFKNIPHTIGEWTGEDRVFADEIYDELRADENFFRIYTNVKGEQLGLYIGYYGTKRGGHPEHIPKGCYTGAGWGVASENPIVLASIENGKSITANNLYAVKGTEGEVVIYWLQNFRGTVTHEGFGQNFEKMYTKLLFNRNDGAFVRVNSAVQTTREDTIAFQKEFIAQLLPLLADNWPVEEVQR